MKTTALLASALFVLSACGPGPLRTASTATPQVPAAVVQRGPIQQSINASAEVRAKAQITIQPQASGQLRQVFVDVGSHVSAGDALAQLDTDNPQLAVLQAQANLAAAQAKLAMVQAGARPDDVAQAEETVAQQQARLAAMQAQGRPEDAAAAQAALRAQQAKLMFMLQGGRVEAVQAARDVLDQAEQKLALLQQGATDDVRQAALSAVKTDQANVVAAEANYAALGGNASADLQNLQRQVDALSAQVEAAQSALTSATAALTSQTRSTAADVQAAQTAYDQAQASLSAAQAAVNQASNPPQALVAQAQAALDQARSQRAGAQANQTALEQHASGVCSPVISPVDGHTVVAANGTACGSARAAADAAVQAGDAAVESAQGQLDLLKRGGAPATLVSLQAQLASAQALVKATGARLDAVANGGVQAQRAQGQAAKDLAQSQLTAALDNQSVAQARLDAARSGTLEAQRKAALAQVEAANQKLTADQVHLEQVVAGPPNEEIQQAQDAVDQARQQLALAGQPTTAHEVTAQQALVEQSRQQLLKAQQPFTDFDIQQQEHALAQAEAALRARATPFTDNDRAVAQAQVDQSQVALEQAQLALSHTRITAPVDGIVLERQANPGAMVGPQTPIVTLIPPSVEIATSVNEAQLTKIQPGQTVQIELAAYADQPLSGTVSAVAPAVDSKTRTASVRIDPTAGPDQMPLYPGMQAVLTIVTTKPDALVVPRAAVIGLLVSGAQATVVALDDGRASYKSVRLGLVDVEQAEITSGLQEGELVAVANASGLINGQAVVPQPGTAYGMTLAARQ